MKTFSAGELDLLAGFQALRSSFGQTLTVISDPNNDTNTDADTTVGQTFIAVVSPTTEADLQTMLGSDIRYDAWAEVDKKDDPLVEETARLSDGVTTWRVFKYDRNAAVATNRYSLIEVDPKADE